MFLSRVTWNKFLLPSGLPRPLVITLRAYTKDQLVRLVADGLRRDDLLKEEEDQGGERRALHKEFYLAYASIILSENSSKVLIDFRIFACTYVRPSNYFLYLVSVHLIYEHVHCFRSLSEITFLIFPTDY